MSRKYQPRVKYGDYVVHIVPGEVCLDQGYDIIKYPNVYTS